jgi:GT2 family glycosyltransferase
MRQRVVTISCSVVSGKDPGAIVTFLESLRRGGERLPDGLTTTAIINSGDKALAERVAPIADRVVVLPAPQGFAANHNAVLRTTTAEFHVIANDDVVVTSDCLAELLDVMGTPGNEDVAVVSPLLRNPDGSVQPSTYGFPSACSVAFGWSGLRERTSDASMRRLATFLHRGSGKSRHWDHDREVSVDTLRGAFVVVRTEAVRQIGLMSEVALVGGEETEWHARMKRAGWRVLFTPRTAVTHTGRVTTGDRPDLEIEYVKGTVNFFAQHASRAQFTLVKILGVLRVAYLRRRHLTWQGRALPLYGRSVASISFRDKA